MVSIIKVSVLLHSPIPLFFFLSFLLSVLSLSPHSLRTPILLWLAIHTAIFWKTENLFSALTMCTNQIKLLQQHGARVLINKIWEFHNSCWTLSCTLDCAPLFLQFSFLCVSSGFPPEEQVLNPPTHPASVLLILNPQIYRRSRPLQTQRTTIHTHYFPQTSSPRHPAGSYWWGQNRTWQTDNDPLSPSL